MISNIPIKLVSEANAHEHWRIRAKRARGHRKAALLVKLGAMPCVITITRIAPRSLDSDNLVGCAKHLRDGIAHRLGISDNDPRVVWKVLQRKGKPKEYSAAVEIVPA